MATYIILLTVAPGGHSSSSLRCDRLLTPLQLHHAAELILPLVERRLADAVIAAQVRRLHARLRFLQYCDDLILLNCDGGVGLCKTVSQHRNP